MCILCFCENDLRLNEKKEKECRKKRPEWFLCYKKRGKSKENGTNGGKE